MLGISMKNISKYFASKAALKDVSIDIHKGSVHAIIGENGAGKSTLMNILGGVLSPTAGEIRINGELVQLGDPKDAAKVGIGMVHQHFMLVPSLTVWQNIVLGVEPTKRFGFVDKVASIDLLKKTCDTYGIDLDPMMATGALTVGEQQRLEILKVLAQNAEYIILDEPTSVLTPQETEQLFKNIRMLKEHGKTIVFISHKLEEVFEIADRITVLRRGETQYCAERSKTNPAVVVKHMVGREVDLSPGYPKESDKGSVVLSVNQVSTRRSGFSSGLNEVTFSVCQGEVFGIAGVDGNGQEELVKALLGLESTTEGEIIKGGKSISGLPASDIRKQGVALIPPDRQTQGLVLNSTVMNNLVLGCESNSNVCGKLLFNQKKLNAFTRRLAKDYDIRMPSLRAHAAELSGGNQQKIILAREIGFRDADLIIAVNPTRGLDVGAIEFVHTQIEEQKSLGRAILLVSTELTEILRLCDRIAVLYKGQINGILDREKATAEKLGMLMAGLPIESYKE